MPWSVAEKQPFSPCLFSFCFLPFFFNVPKVTKSRESRTPFLKICVHDSSNEDPQGVRRQIAAALLPTICSVGSSCVLLVRNACSANVISMPRLLTRLDGFEGSLVQIRAPLLGGRVQGVASSQSPWGGRWGTGDSWHRPGSPTGGDALFPERKSGWDLIPWSPGLPETTGKVVRESQAAAWGSAFLDRKLEAGLPRGGQSLERGK